MRILPVSNYNYQSKTQNNKQQNVNFGMFKCTSEEAESLCNLAGFTKAGKRLRTFMANLGKKVRNASGEMVDGRKFNVEEKAQLEALAKRAENMVMSPEEGRFVEPLLSLNEGEFKNEHSIAVIDVLTACPNLVTPAIQHQLDLLARTVAAKEKYKADYSSSVIIDKEIYNETIASYLQTIEAIKQKLYVASVVHK